MDGTTLSALTDQGCETICRDFLREELPELAEASLARYLASLIGSDLAGKDLTIKARPFQCVDVSSSQGESSATALGMNMTRDATGKAVSFLGSSTARDRRLVYLFSFDRTAGEEDIAEAVMEAEMLKMVRGSGITVYFAVNDGRAGMGMMARIDGDMRTIEYLPF